MKYFLLYAGLLVLLTVSGCVSLPPTGSSECNIDSDCSSYGDNFICDANGDCVACPVVKCATLPTGCWYEPDDSARCPSCGTLKCNPTEPAPTCRDGKQNGNEEGIDCGGVCPACPDGHPMYEPYEQEFTDSGSYSNPYYYVNEADVIITTPSGVKKTVPMFWEGDDIWKFRYSPMEEGTHTYTTKSSDSGLNGKTGSFNAVNMGKRGFWEIDSANPFNFKYSEKNKPRFMLGDTFWNSFSDAGEMDREAFEDYIDIRASQGFNFIRIYTVPFYYEPNANQPELNPQHWNEGGLAFIDWDHDKLNPEYFKEVEERIAYANSKGLTVHLVTGSDRNLMTKFFGWDDGGKRMERYIKHLAARLDAYDINWEGRTEFEEQDNKRTSGEPTAMELANKLGNWIEEYGVHNHLQSMHTLDTSEELAGESWFDWIMHQGNPGTKSDALNDGRTYSWSRVATERTHGLPVFNEEYYYENLGDPTIWGHHRDSDSVRKGAWILMMHGSPGIVFGNVDTYNARGRPFKGVEYAQTVGAGYMTNLKIFFSEVDFWKLEPKLNICSTGYCLVGDGEYLAYSESGSSLSVKLGEGTYDAQFYNPRDGRYQQATSVTGCERRTLNKPDSNDWVLHLKKTSSTPSCEGEFPGSETIVMQDDLQGSTKAGTKYGGTFTSEGYKPGKGTNHIMFDVPKQIWNGYVEVEVKGFDFSKFPADESNSNTFYAFYDGRGISEPINYADYRANFFRWETVYRSSRVINGKDYGNVFKGKMMIASPQTSGSLSSGEKAVFPLYPDEPEKTYAIADWKNEPSGVYASWDPNKWYIVRTEWNNDDKTFRILRDDGTGFVEYWNMQKERGKAYSGFESERGIWYSSTPDIPYYPVDFKISLGSVAHDKYDNEMPDIIYRNFKVVSLD